MPGCCANRSAVARIDLDTFPAARRLNFGFGALPRDMGALLLHSPRTNSKVHVTCAQELNNDRGSTMTPPEVCLQSARLQADCSKDPTNGPTGRHSQPIAAYVYVNLRSE